MTSPGPAPDLTLRYQLKIKYTRLQKAYQRSLEKRKDLQLEVQEKEGKVQKLQDEVDMILDQIHDSDYKHLKPETEDLFSDTEEEEGKGSAPPKLKVVPAFASTAGGEEVVAVDNPPEPDSKRPRLDPPPPAPSMGAAVV